MPSAVNHNGPSAHSFVRDNTELRSNAVNEIVSARPGFLIRHGIGVFLGVLLLATSVTWFVRYPDVVTARAKLTSINAPKEVKTKVTGRLERLLVREGQTINQDEAIGIMESNASYKEIMDLARLTDSAESLCKHSEQERLACFIFPELQNLGEIQPAYQNFVHAFTLYRQYLTTGYYSQKMRMLQRDIGFLERLHANLMQQKGMQEEDLGLAKETFSANETLGKEKVISPFEYRNEKSKYIGKALMLPQTNAAIINNESNQHEKKKEMLQLENEIAQQKTVFLQELNTLKFRIEEWKSKYVLSAPTTGAVSFAGFIQEKQQLDNGFTVCFLNPGNSCYYAELNIPQTNFGKIKEGQKVVIKLPAYPDQEYGVLEGYLNGISNIATDSGYRARVVFSRGLVSSYHKTIQYYDGLIGQADIITADLRLSDRFINEIKKVFKRD